MHRGPLTLHRVSEQPRLARGDVLRLVLPAALALPATEPGSAAPAAPAQNELQRALQCLWRIQCAPGPLLWPDVGRGHVQLQCKHPSFAPAWRWQPAGNGQVLVLQHAFFELRVWGSRGVHVVCHRGAACGHQGVLPNLWLSSVCALQLQPCTHRARLVPHPAAPARCLGRGVAQPVHDA